MHEDSNTLGVAMRKLVSVFSNVNHCNQQVLSMNTTASCRNDHELWYTQESAEPSISNVILQYRPLIIGEHNGEAGPTTLQALWGKALVKETVAHLLEGDDLESILSVIDAALSRTDACKALQCMPPLLNTLFSASQQALHLRASSCQQSCR